MGIQYGSLSFTGFQEYVTEAKRGVLNSGQTPIYAVEMDGWIITALNSAALRPLISRAIDALVSYQFGREIASSVTISKRSFAELYSVLVHCARTLGIPTPHAVARHDSSLFNAYTAGTDDYAFIGISSALLQVFPKEEAAFVIGHECGHVAARHAMYQTLVNALTNAAMVTLAAPLTWAASVPLYAWSRRAEVTADRAGLLCCGDPAVAERALARLVTGFADLDQVDLDDYIRGAIEGAAVHKVGVLGNLFQSHPLIPRRIAALRLFASSELYHNLAGKPRPQGKTLLAREQLERQVARLLQP